MGDRGVHRYDHVKQRNDGRGVGEILNLVADAQDIGMTAQNVVIVIVNITLQADHVNSRGSEQRREPLEGDRPVMIVRVGRAASPHQSDQHRLRRQPFSP
jgi:hypothetical protein